MAQIIELGQRTLTPNSKDFWVEYYDVVSDIIKQYETTLEVITAKGRKPDARLLFQLQADIIEQKARLARIAAKIKTFEKGNNNG